MKIRRSCVAATVALASGLSASAAAGPAGLPAGPGGGSTPNVHLVTNIPTGTGTGGQFLGTTYFQTSADAVWFHATSTAPVTGGLLAFDASNPEMPKPVGSLPIPHYENEDLSISESRKLAVISEERYRSNPADPTSDYVGGREYLIDVSIPSAMRIVGVALLPGTVGKRANGRTLGGPGHIATLVGNDSYLWVSGARNGSVYVVDIKDPVSPKVLGSFTTPAGEATALWDPGVVHDVDVDKYGDVWVTGSGGTALYALSANPLKPTLLARITTADNRKAQQFIHHGSQRLDFDHVLVTEEDYEAGCDGSSHQDGSLQVWRIDRKARRLVQVSSYDAPKNADASGPLSSLCSSHWFTVNANKVVADAWYAAGVRFLDYSDPAHPRPVGVWAGDSTIASQARFVPGRPDLVYVADYNRGLDVVKIDNGGRGAKTVSPKDEKTSTTTPGGLQLSVTMHKHEDFGWVCAVASPLAASRP